MLDRKEKVAISIFAVLVGGLLLWESQDAVIAAPGDGNGPAFMQPEDKPADNPKKGKKRPDKKDDRGDGQDDWEDYVPEDEQPDNPYAPDIRRLKKDEISQIRFMEMNAMRGGNDVEKIIVGITRDVANDFLLEMAGHEDFRSEQTRRNFMKLTPAQKVHYIAKYTGTKFAERIEIKSDPDIFSEFRRNVMPYVIRGCATGGCHNSLTKEAYGFKLFKDPRRSPSTMYANFIVLNDFANESGKMIDRNSPQNSLLANYLLEPDQVSVELRHPGDVKYRHPFKNRKNKGYKRIVNWMGSLKIPAEDYGVRLLPEFVPNPTPFGDPIEEGNGDDKPEENPADKDNPTRERRD